MQSQRQPGLELTVGLAVFFGSQAAAVIFPGLKLQLFSRSAAGGAAFFLGTTSVQNESGYLLNHPSLSVHVVEACSGHDFFSLLAAVLCAVAVRFSSRPLRDGFLLLPAALVLTIAANASRIVCAVYAQMASRWLPAGPSPEALHFAVGVFVFATTLVLSVLALRFIYEHARCQSHPARSEHPALTVS